MPDRPKPLLAPDRVRIYLTLVPYLAERGQVSVADAAADFDVSVDEMRAMAEKLTVMGLPGDSGFYQLDPDLFNINWDLLDEHDVIELTNMVALERAPKLSSREAAALLSGLQLTRAIAGVSPELVDGLIAKLTAGSSAEPVNVIVAPPRADAVRIIVADALRQRRAVSFTYRAPDAEPTTRTVDPVRVHITSGEWYLQGWCHLRHAMRTFHLDRVSDVAVTDIEITHAGDDAPPAFSDTHDGAEAVIRYPSQLASLVGDYLRGAELTTEHEFSIARFTVGDPLTLKRLAALRSGTIEVLGPESARAATIDWAQRALAQYDAEAN
ncbi:helix-turn-helix transcriptional regulator [Microbacterium sp. YY-03]|uniref:helix-turn-helix transcriptional regulator n=1 Tax=Microbacterium sp. YY-03 TaxID=3421636 RepID=UPI003D17958E